jgi:hypothetical protein
MSSFGAVRLEMGRRHLTTPPGIGGAETNPSRLMPESWQVTGGDQETGVSLLLHRFRCELCSSRGAPLERMVNRTNITI